MEHSPVSIDHLEHLIRAAETAGIAPVVRVSGISEAEILHPLDKGAAGLLVPMVNTPDLAETVVRYAKYAPEGSRGMDIYARSARFGATPKQEYLREANAKTVLAVQIEGRDGLENAAEIARIDAVDVVYIGPYDLSQSLGIPGQIDDPRVTEAAAAIAAEVTAAGKGVGIYVDDVATAARYLKVGIQFITLSVDAVIFLKTCKELVAELKEKQQ
jgi:4-hydroxy-2-oxoheptanedioate aldolase